MLIDKSGADALVIGDSRAMSEVRRLIRQVAPSDASVIVTGPSGSGKEMVARAIHAASRRADRPLVAVNTGAIPRELLESELFGHERGAFTGAHAQHRGRFEEAHGGTLFLDEIGDMPADCQVKLLRVLETRRVQRVGGRGEVAADARIISATHRDIDSAIASGAFREDLFYRLAVFPIDLPCLAERREDVAQLVDHFMRRTAERGARPRFDARAMIALAEHGWPGNVRELRNVVERACIIFPNQLIGAEQAATLINPRLRAPAPRPAVAGPPVLTVVPAPAERPADAERLSGGPVDLRNIVADLEQSYINEALARADGVVAEAARLLSLQRTTLIEKMRKHGVSKAA